MTYINLETLKYPIDLYSIRENNPCVSFPENPDEEALAAVGMATITLVDKPAYNKITQEVVQGTPVTDKKGAWFSTWTIKDLDYPTVLAEQKVLKKNEIKSAYAFEMARGYAESTLGFIIDASSTAIEDINNLLNMMIINKETKVAFRDYANEMHDISIDDLRILQQEALTKSIWNHTHKWQLEAAISSATTVGAVLNINW